MGGSTFLDEFISKVEESISEIQKDRQDELCAS
jgi:hypothetical protein